MDDERTVLTALATGTRHHSSTRSAARCQYDQRAAFPAIVKARPLIVRLKEKNMQVIPLPRQELSVNETLMVPLVSVVWVGNLCALPLAR